MEQSKYVIGVDYGTDSVRSVVIDTRNGAQLASAVFQYPRWAKGLYCDPVKNQFRQHPKDYLEGLKYTIKKALDQCDPEVASNVVGLSVDTTGSTPIAVDASGHPFPC